MLTAVLIVVAVIVVAFIVHNHFNKQQIVGDIQGLRTSVEAQLDSHKSEIQATLNSVVTEVTTKVDDSIAEVKNHIDNSTITPATPVVTEAPVDPKA